MSSYDFILNGQNINERILNFSYSESLDDVASSFSFDALDDYGISQNNKINRIQLLDKTTQKIFYDGRITDWEHTTDVNKYHYSGFDVGFYLNQNKVIKQFPGKNIRNSIIELCNEYDVKYGTLPEFVATVKKIYKDTAFSDILKELLQFEKDKGGLKDAFIDCKNGKLNILQYQVESNLSALIANNISVSSHDTINNVKVTKSIQELKNRVIYYDDKKKITSLPKSDSSSISTFGLLQTVEHPDSDNKTNLNILAQNKLNELNKIKETYELSILGDYRIKKGVLIDFKVSKYNIDDVFLIKTVSHNITNNKEVVTLSMDIYKTN